MLVKSTALVAAALLAVAGCSSSGGTSTSATSGGGQTSGQNATGQSSGQSSTTESASTSAAESSTSTSAGGGTAGGSVSPRGAASPECQAMSTILSGLTTVGLKAATGTVAQSDVDAIFTDEAVKAVPADAQSALAAVRDISGRLVDKNQQDASAMLGDWTQPFENFTNATMSVCS